MLDRVVPTSVFGRPVLNWDNIVDDGKAILRVRKLQIASICTNAYEATFAGHRVPVVNSCTLHSEVGHVLCQNRPFAVTWFRQPDGQIRHSLRSDESGLDVSEIARAFGGNGHPRAAGFRANSILPVA